mmetsp:Transcript_24904/g.69953  ORF Transcript_24904/g.69953 Transcript_24904/m.69953 type:complete len:184 (+) Transcript_24904:107-658(+)
MAKRSSGSSTGDEFVPRGCLLGEVVCAIAADTAAGGFASAFSGGSQSASQFVIQGLAAGAGGTYWAKAPPSECPLMQAARESQERSPWSRSAPADGKEAIFRFFGASIGALLAWLAFPPDLDFQIFASAVLCAAGGAAGSIYVPETEASFTAGVVAKGEAPPSVVGMSELRTPAAPADLPEPP